MKMHQTPDLPGTSPVTDNPNPGGTQGADTTGPSTGPNPTASSPGPEGAGRKTFRCADVGFADCRWEVSGQTPDELLPQIERHGREQHGLHEIGENLRRRVLDAIRARRAA